MENNDFNYETEYLPIGTIVSVRFNTNKFMIIGYCTLEGNTKKMYDYSAVVYPFGLENFDNIIMFNKDIIKKVYHMGYTSLEHNDLNEKIKIAKKKYNESEKVNL